jgi:hypothetical protein
MPTFYLDFLNGNDSNDGTTFANRWKTITSGATAARIAPGDTIRMIMSPQPTSIGNATWTNLSNTVTLASALTATIDLCNTAWTAATNVTTSTTGTRKEGSVAATITFGAAFTTGLAAHRTISSTDFSSYEQVSFWIRTNIAFSSGVLTLRLCSDTAGTVTVDTLPIPGISVVNQYHPVAVDNAAALGSAIQSVALYAESDPGTPQIVLDDIIACKASSSADSLTLVSLIGKNTSEETFYGIQSIVDTTVLLDRTTNTAPGGVRGYVGTSETVTTYKREPIPTATSTGNIEVIQDSGTSGSLITFIGGWNDTDGSTQIGETWLDSRSGHGNAIVFGGQDFVRIETLSLVRANNGYQITDNSENCELHDVHANNCSTDAILIDGDFANIGTIVAANNNGNRGILHRTELSKIDKIISVCDNAVEGVYLLSKGCVINEINRASNNTARGIRFTACLNCEIGKVTSVKNNGSSGYRLDTGCLHNFIRNAGAIESNGDRGIAFVSSNDDNRFYNLTTTSNTSAAIFLDSGNQYFRNATFNEATKVNGQIAMFRGIVYIINNDTTDDNHLFIDEGGNMSSESTVRHTASGIAWKLQPTSTTSVNVNHPLRLSIAKIAVNASSLVTVKAWLRRTNTAITGTLMCKGGQIAGVLTDVSSPITVAADTWEELTLTFTPTEKGVVEITAEAYGGTTHTVYVDDLTVTQA